MKVSVRRINAIAVATAGLLTTQTVTAGVLFTHNGTQFLWETPSGWTGGTGIPDQTTEDARLLSSNTGLAVRTNINIGGIRGEIGSQPIIDQPGGSLTLHGIAPGGTTFFTNSSLDRLTILNGGVFANSGSSNLTINRLNVFGTGRFRNTANALGRLDLIGPNTKSFSGNAEMDNQGTLKLGSQLNVEQNAIINNRLGGTFTQTTGFTILRNSSRFLNDATFNNNAAALVTTDFSLFVNSGDFTQTSGFTRIEGASTFNNTGTYRHNGGTTDVWGAAILENSSLFEHNAGTLTLRLGGTFNNIGDAQINGGTIQVDAGSTINGIGFATLNGGTLNVNGEMIQTGFGGLFAGLTMNGGTLAGGGVVRADILNAGGTVGPGNSPGTLTVDGDYTQGAAGTLAMEIDSLLAFDVLDIMGDAALDGILDLQVDAAYAASAQNGDTFTIIEWDSFSGAFSSVTGLNFAANKFFTLDYGATGLTLTVNGETIATPEPGAIGLLGASFASFWIARRRKLARKAR